MGAGSRSNETIFTAPQHFRTLRRSDGPKRAKQYPGNSGQSIRFFRSFQRLQRLTVGRKTSIPLIASWSRTACSCLDLVQTANQQAGPVPAGAHPASPLALTLSDRHAVRSTESGIRGSFTRLSDGTSPGTRPLIACRVPFSCLMSVPESTRFQKPAAWECCHVF